MQGEDAPSPRLSPSRHSSGLDDVLTVVARLRPRDGDILERILRHLGYVERPAALRGDAGRARTPSAADSSPAPRAKPLEQRRTMKEEPRASEARKPIRSQLEHESGAAEAPQWLHETVPYPVPADFRPAYRLPMEPLFDPRRSRALVQRMVSKSLPVGPIDVAQVVRRAARLAPLATLPRRPRDDLRMGVQLLLDIGPAMQPYAQDVAAFAAEVVSVAGHAGTEICCFRNAPLRGVIPPGGWLPEEYRLPAPGIPVIALTELGLAAVPGRTDMPPRPDEWLALAESLRRRQSPLTVLTPYPRHRLPAGMAAKMRILSWDRGLGVRGVESATGDVKT